MTAWAAAYGRECGCDYAEGFRQHLGHAHPRDPVLQNALAGTLRFQGIRCSNKGRRSGERVG